MFRILQLTSKDEKALDVISLKLFQFEVDKEFCKRELLSNIQLIHYSDIPQTMFDICFWRIHTSSCDQPIMPEGSLSIWNLTEDIQFVWNFLL
jgi:hypothetical protein